MFDVEKSLRESKENRNLIRNLVVTQKIKKKWKEIIGNVLFKELNFQYILNETCVIGVKTTLWYTEIKYYEDHVITKIINNLINDDSP